MRDPRTLLDEAAAVHGHLCPGQVLCRARAGQAYYEVVAS
jgi:formylmethanofuran dehydrogenase subunit E